MKTSSRFSTKILVFNPKVSYCFLTAFSVQQSKRKLINNVWLNFAQLLRPAKLQALFSTFVRNRPSCLGKLALVPAPGQWALAGLAPWALWPVQPERAGLEWSEAVVCPAQVTCGLLEPEERRGSQSGVGWARVQGAPHSPHGGGAALGNPLGLRSSLKCREGKQEFDISWGRSLR